MEDKLREILPKYYEYKVISFEEGESNNFDAAFRVNLFNEIEVKNWLKQFEQCSFTNFRVARTAPLKRTRVLFKKYYRCHHNTRASETASKTKKAHVKHTGCEATLLITVNNSGMKSCKQVDLKRFPCTVKYHNYHNHPLTSDELLCHRKPSERIEQKIRELLLKNHTPASALKILKQDLQQEFKDEYSKIVKDGAFCPKLQWIYHKHYSIFKEMCSDSYDLNYSPSEFLIEEFEETDSEAETNQTVVPVTETESLRPSTHLNSNEDNDITYEEYILSSEEKSLFENHFVEVYTVNESDIQLEDNENAYITEDSIVDLPLIGEEIADSYDELSVLEIDTSSDNDYDSSNGVKNLDQNSVKESVLWNGGSIKHEVNELNVADLSDIFGDTCNEIKLNVDVFLPMIKEDSENYKKK